MNAAIRKFARKGAALSSGPIARGSMVSVAIRVTGLVLSFVQAILAARLLGVEGYGLAAVALSVAQIGATLALFGYGSLATREIAGWLSSGKQHLLTPFSLHAVRNVVILSIIAAGVLWFAGGMFAQYSNVIRIAAFAIPALALVLLLRGISQGFGDVASAQWPGEILRPLLIIGMILAGFVLYRDVTASTFLVAVAIASAIAVLVGGILARKRLLRHAAAADHCDPETARFAAKAAPFFGLSILAIVQGELAVLLLAIFASPEQAGLFQPVARLTPLMTLPGQAAAMRFAPRVAELWTNQENERLASIVHTFTITTSVLTIGVCLAVAIAGPLILAAFGPEFVAAAPLLWIIAGVQIFNAACGPIGYLTIMTGHTTIATNCQLAGLVASFLTGLYLIPDMGALGAACAIAAGLFVWNAVLLIMARRKLSFDPSIVGALIKYRRTIQS